MRAARVRAFAKINLSLQVIGTRPDGYHELRTVFQSIALHDTITVRRRPGPFQLTCDDPACPSDRTNLVWRAAEQVWRASGRRGRPRGISVHIVKRIPMQAGLGGGSSDAAAALRLFGAMWRVPSSELRTIGAGLGADVPFFFEGGTVLGLDRGDALFPLRDRPAAAVVLVVPGFGVSTTDAFGWFDQRGRPRRFRGAANDLEPVVRARHPLIGRLVDALRRSGADEAGMSGSGSAVFGLFSNRRAAERAVIALNGLRDRQPIRLVALTRTMARRRYQRLAASQPIG
jgi:4-diphosphocytidyl-2-C-methyl-D-erythritol kinase